MTHKTHKHVDAAGIADHVADAIVTAIRIYESPQGIGDIEIAGLAVDAAEEIISELENEAIF